MVPRETASLLGRRNRDAPGIDFLHAEAFRSQPPKLYSSTYRLLAQPGNMKLVSSRDSLPPFAKRSPQPVDPVDFSPPPDRNSSENSVLIELIHGTTHQAESIDLLDCTDDDEPPPSGRRPSSGGCRRTPTCVRRPPRKDISARATSRV